MKRLVILLALLVLPMQLIAQDSASFRTFNLKRYGAKGDNATNDAAALKLAVAAVNAAGGGTLYVPDGTYLLQYGDPTADANLFAPNGGVYTPIYVNTDNFKIQMSRNARLRVVVSFLNTSVCCPQAWGYHTYMIHFGDGTTVKKYFEWDGGGASQSVTFETTGGATVNTGINNTNDWVFYGGSSRYSWHHDITIDGFSAGGILAGEAVTETDGTVRLYADAVLERYYVTNYGGCGHCNWAYLNGNTTVRDFLIKSTRSDQSHGFYWGARTPNILIEHGTVDGVGANASDNSYGIQVYRESGTDQPEGFTIRKVRFYNSKEPIYIQQFGGYDSRRFTIQDCEFFAPASPPAISTAIQMFAPAEGHILHNKIRGFPSTIKIISPTTGRNLLIDGNVFENCGGSSIRMNYSTISNTQVYGGINGSASRISIDGIGNKIVHNQVINGGSTPSGGTGIAVVGADNTIAENTIASDDGRGYLNIFSAVGVTNCKILSNQFTAAVTGTNGAYLITGTGLDIRGNYFGNTPIVQGGASGDTNRFDSNTVISGSGARPQITGTVKTIFTNNILLGGYRTPESSEMTGVINGLGNSTSAGLDTLVSSATPLAIHAGAYRNVVYTATASTTFDAPLNPTTGSILNITIIQDATGGRTITWNSAFKVSCSFTTTANTKSSISFRYDGTHWVQTSACVTGL